MFAQVLKYGNGNNQHAKPFQSKGRTIPKDDEGYTLSARMHTSRKVAEHVAAAIGAEGIGKDGHDGHSVDLIVTSASLAPAINKAHTALVKDGFRKAYSWDEKGRSFHEYAKEEFLDEDPPPVFGESMITHPKDLRTVTMSHRSYDRIMDDPKNIEHLNVTVRHNQKMRERKGELSAQNSEGGNPYVFTPKGVESRPDPVTGKPKKAPKGKLTEADMIALGTAPGQVFPTIRGTRQGGGNGIPTYSAPGNPVSMSAKFDQILKGSSAAVVRKYNPKGINQYTKTGTSVEGPRDRLVGATKHQQRLMTTYMTGFTKNLKNPAEKAYAEARVAQMIAGQPRPEGMSSKHGLEKSRAIGYETLIYKIFQSGRKKHNV